MHRQNQTRFSSQTKQLKSRTTSGVFCVLIPLFDLVVISLRYGLASSVIEDYGVTLSRKERAKDAFTQVTDNNELAEQLRSIGGIEVKSQQLELKINKMNPDDKTAQSATNDSDIDGRQITVNSPGRIPKAWLPDETKGTCTYTLKLIVDAEIAPALTLKSNQWRVPIAGLTTPMHVTFAKQSQWENLGRDPVTSEYFINE
jgi:hypothetical protein